MKLNTANLTQIHNTVKTPTYDRAAITCGIVHLGIGGFHRSHQALYLDEILAKGHSNWGICGVGLMPQDQENINALKAQDGLYTLLERTAETDTARIIGSCIQQLYAPENPHAVLDILAHPDTKIASLTVTEKGYCYNTQGDLDVDNPLIQHDLTQPSTPKTALGYLVHSLAMRQERDIPSYTIMSCDNLPENGHLTQRLVLQFAERVNSSLAQWIKENTAFPNAMVDRITPVTTPEVIEAIKTTFTIDDSWPVISEDYRQWVLEDNFCYGRPPFDEVGVQLVPDVEPYEKMKVRLLNGSHSALAYVSYLMGYRAVDKAMNDPLIRDFIRAYMDTNVTPSLPHVWGVDLDAYKTSLITRFSNPAVSDQIQRLAEDGSRKIPNAILPCIQHQITQNGTIDLAAFALAAWFRYLTGIDEDGAPITLKDPLATQLQAHANSLSDMLAIRDIFGDNLPQSAPFVSAITRALTAINQNGTRDALATYMAEHKQDGAKQSA